MNVKRHKASSTEIRYDNLFREEEESASQGFKSSRNKRHQFKLQAKSQFQDEEDIADELSHLRLAGDFKDLTGALEVTLREVGEKAKVKKKKVKIQYFDGEEEEEDQDKERDKEEGGVRLKKVESQVKFIKNAKLSDPVFKNFHKSEYKPSMSSITLPENFTSPYKLQDTFLTRAKNSLSSKFTSTSTSTVASQKETVPRPRKVIKKITIDPIILKRLGI